MSKQEEAMSGSSASEMRRAEEELAKQTAAAHADMKARHEERMKVIRDMMADETGPKQEEGTQP